LSFECERRGAKRVVMTNVRNVADSDFTLAGRGTLEARRQRQIRVGRQYWFDDGCTSRGALLLKKWFGSKVEIVYATVYELTDIFDNPFDYVLCCGLLYHLRDPILKAYASQGGGRIWFLCGYKIRFGPGIDRFHIPQLSIEAAKTMALIGGVSLFEPSGQ